MRTGIYIPGLANDIIDMSVESYANRLANEMDVNNLEKDCIYEVQMTKVKFGRHEKYNTDVASIIERQNGQSKTVYTLYAFNYAKDLTERFENSNVFIKALLLFYCIIRQIPVFVRSLFIRNSSVSLKFRLQTLYFTAFIFMISCMGLLILPSLINVILQVVEKSSGIIPIHITNRVMGFGLEEASKTIVGITAFVYFFVPKLPGKITITATHFVCANYYLSIGEKRQYILGKLDSLIEKASETENADKLDLHTYSFGSIIALDLLYPYGNSPSIRVRNNIETLVTIGCPHDFIGAYYPQYYKNRTSQSITLKNWYNIFSLSDVLSSNFRDDNKNESAKYTVARQAIVPENLYFEPVNPKALGIVDFVCFYSFKAHTLFWDSDLSGQSCLRTIVEVYKRDKHL